MQGSWVFRLLADSPGQPLPDPPASAEVSSCCQVCLPSLAGATVGMPGRVLRGPAEVSGAAPAPSRGPSRKPGLCALTCLLGASPKAASSLQDWAWAVRVGAPGKGPQPPSRPPALPAAHTLSNRQLQRESTAALSQPHTVASGARASACTHSSSWRGHVGAKGPLL